MDESHDGGPWLSRASLGTVEGRSLDASRARGDHERRSEPDSTGSGSLPPADRPARETAQATGRVYLVGAGPGDPELLTRRAWAVIQRADAILYDSLVSDALLSEIPPEVRTVDVGKRSPEPITQAEIHDRLLDRARAGEVVVRLKGGDPNVFGRGGEEAQRLASEDVQFEMIPGVSSVLAAPSVAGIPLTHREHASSLTVVTGHETPSKDESALDWAALAESVRAGGTLVVLMGVGTLSTYVAHLREEDLPPETPLAIVEKATWDDEQTVTTTLDDAVTDAQAADVSPPAVTIVGDVVAVRDQVTDSLQRGR